jgi:hypothetical protein
VHSSCAPLRGNKYVTFLVLSLTRGTTERARSISPTKDSPVSTPTAADRAGHSRITLSPPPDLQPTTEVLTRDKVLDTDMDCPVGEGSPTKENSISFNGSERAHAEKDVQRVNSIKESPSSSMPPSRNSPLSWQRRPTSQTSDQPRSRPLSMIAAENAASSPRATPEPSPPADGQTPTSRNQIAQMLSSKDPTWFRQTAERGENSPAYRKNQVEDIDVVDVVSSSRVQLPGMSREQSRLAGSVSSGSMDINRSASPSRNSSSTGTVDRSLFTGIGSPVPLTSAQRLDPPTNSALDDTIGSRRPLAMSPSQGRISPERDDRPTSPTKGMGGFVQSAMMKRSDSVSKRWSVQSPPGLSRGNSIASNRSSVDTTANQYTGGSLSRESRPNSVSRDNSPLPLSRPTSSHSNATIVQDGERPGTSSSMRSLMTVSTTNDGFAKPALPTNRSQLSSGARDGDVDVAKASQSEITPPSSPSKLGDTRRWSPTKSSWLESALNKPESPKPKLAPPPPQQPAWMSEISKAKQRNNAESTRSPPAPKHEVNIGGLLRSPPPGGLAKPPGIGMFPVGLSSGSTVRKNSTSDDTPTATSQLKAPLSSSESLQGEPANKPEEAKSTAPSTLKESVSNTNTQSPTGKVKPETPPKKDFRANLKPRQLPSDSNGKEEPEFKNVFGQLRRTKTQNYVAPDELKDNILRGKAGLNVTGGPKKTERKDEFKEAILKKKDDFKKAQLEGTGVTRSASGSSQKSAPPLPEALAKKAALGKTNIDITRNISASNDANTGLPEAITKLPMPKELPMPSLHKETSAPGRMQSKEAAGGKLADRFNPALANLLARGPPSTASDISRTSSPVTSQRTVSTSTRTTNPDDPGSGPQLTHMTKARARGPRRKAPSTLPTNNQTSKEAETAEQTRPEVVSLQHRVQKENVLSDGGKKTATVQSLDKDNSENEAPQPPSPQKLDIKRRSRFLEEVSNQNEKTLQQLDPPKPRSPTKKAIVDELPVTKQEPKSPVSERKVTPSTKPKPSALSTAAVPTEQAMTSKVSSKPLNISNNPLPAVFSLPKTKTQSSSPLQATDKPQAAETAIDTDSVVSVKSGAALFSRQAAKEGTRQSTTVKAPIKLPTQADENAAMLGAGLRSPDSGSSRETAIATPGRQGSGVMYVTGDNNSDSTMLPLSRKANGTTAAVEKPARQLPTSPSKVPVSPPLSASIKPSSPRKMTNQAVPHSSEASKLLVDFFGKNNFVPNSNIDTAAILSARPDEPIKIKTLRSQLFQLSGDGKKQQVPNHQERILFENNMYICPHTFGTLAGKKVVEVYFWAGDGVAESSIEDAVLFAQREAKAAGGKLIKLRQGQETSEFIEALGGIMITRRGSSNKYDSLAPHILCGRRYAGQIVFDEVDFSTSSLCSGFPYLISTQSGKCYLWKGKGSGVDELSCARLIGMDFGLTGELEEVEDGNEPASFLRIFGNETKIFKSADHWRLKPNYPKYCARLFCADPASKSRVCSTFHTYFKFSWLITTLQITEIHPFTQSSLSPSQIYILDAFFEIYVIVGSASQSQYAAFCTALLFAQEYGILAAGMEDRPFVPVSTVVVEGVPRDLKACFRKWKEGQGPTMGGPVAGNKGLQRGKSLRIVPLNAALDAARF